MTKRTISILTLAVLAVSSAASLFPITASAATSAPITNSGQALEIAPPVINLNADPGQTITGQIYLRDITKGDLIVTGQANDFIAAGEDGIPKILLNDEAANPYSLKSWVGPLPSLRLVPREIKTLKFTITVPSKAAPGGHYGVIRFTATPPDMQGQGVSLSASLGALVLVTVSGKITEHVSLESLVASQGGKVKTLFETAPILFEQVYKNTGNVHEQPTGTIVITDMLGKKVASLGVNTPPRNVLPASSRKFTESLDSSVIGNKLLFGRYTATLTTTYGTGVQPVNGTLTFWVVPYRAIGVSAVILVVAFFILRFLIARYNRHIIAQSQRSHRR